MSLTLSMVVGSEGALHRLASITMSKKHEMSACGISCAVGAGHLIQWSSGYLLGQQHVLAQASRQA